MTKLLLKFIQSTFSLHSNHLQRWIGSICIQCKPVQCAFHVDAIDLYQCAFNVHIFFSCRQALTVQNWNSYCEAKINPLLLCLLLCVCSLSLCTENCTVFATTYVLCKLSICVSSILEICELYWTYELYLHGSDNFIDIIELKFTVGDINDWIKLQYCLELRLVS